MAWRPFQSDMTSIGSPWAGQRFCEDACLADEDDLTLRPREGGIQP